MLMDCPCIVCGERIPEAGRKAAAAGVTERELPASKAEGKGYGLGNARL